MSQFPRWPLPLCLINLLCGSWRHGVNFANILRNAFTCIDPESAKKCSQAVNLFCAFGSVRVKALSKMLMNLTPDAWWPWFGIFRWILNLNRILTKIKWILLSFFLVLFHQSHYFPILRRKVLNKNTPEIQRRSIKIDFDHISAIIFLEVCISEMIVLI